MSSYDIYSYGRMIRDSVRTDAYAEALRRRVGPDSVVLDMGTGVGIFALLACQFGARRVFAVDPNEAIQVARQLAAANACADKIEFIEDFSTRISLPEPADVIVSEMHGILPMFEQNVTSIIDARERLLAQGGTIIPQAERLWAAPVEAPKCYESVRAPWTNRPYGLDMKPALRSAANSWFKVNLQGETLLAEPKSWGTLDYAKVESPNLSGKVNLTATRAGTGHGIAVWFETVLVDGVGFSNAPGEPETIFGQAFFPWLEPVAVSPGDKISLVLRADFVRGHHLWRWETTMWEKAGKEKISFKQSTFFGLPISAEALHKRAEDFLPRLNEDGQFRRLVLSLMDGKTQLGDIANQAIAEFPDRFANYDDAKTMVGDLSEKYSG